MWNKSTKISLFLPTIKYMYIFYKLNFAVVSKLKVLLHTFMFGVELNI